MFDSNCGSNWITGEIKEIDKDASKLYKRLCFSSPLHCYEVKFSKNTHLKYVFYSYRIYNILHGMCVADFKIPEEYVLLALCHQLKKKEDV